MMRIDNVLGLFEQLQSKDITVQQNRCAVVRNRNATCLRCAEACTSGCISLRDDQLVISPEECVGCGTCATVCPTCALEAHNPTDKELFDACVEAMGHAEGQVVIACGQLLEAAAGLYDPDKVVGVTCLGRVEESLLILLARAGARRVTLVQWTCSECRHNPGSKTAKLVCETANTLLAAWGQNMTVRIESKLPDFTRRREDDLCDAERRGFFADVLGTAKATAKTTADYAVSEAVGGAVKPEAAPAIQKVQADGTLPHFLPHRRNRLLKGLASFGEPEDIMVDTRLWGHVIIDTETCTSCQMCATFCPTEAIKKFEDADGTFGIKHYPSRCVKCRCCTDICPADALTLSDEVFVRDLLGRTYERYEMKPRKTELGPHQMLSSVRNLLDDSFIYER